MNKDEKDSPLLVKMIDIIMEHGTEKQKIWFFSKFLPCAIMMSLSGLNDTNRDKNAVKLILNEL